MSNGSFYIEVFARFTGAFGEQCIPAWLPPAWQKNPRKRKLSRQQCNSRNFSDKLLHQLDWLFWYVFIAFRSTNKYFQWTTDHDVIMCREVLVSEPYKFKLRTPERGQAWESVAQQLNSIHQPIFRVTTRSVRDRFSLLSTKYAYKLKMEEKASGIQVEQSELEKLIEEILER